MTDPQRPPYGVLIETARLAAGISLARAVKLADVAKDTWINTVRGHNGDGDAYQARPRTVARMARAVGVEPERLEAEGRQPEAAGILREMNLDGGTAGSEGMLRVGRAVAARRGELGMTQQDLADDAGVDLKTVYNIESGNTWPQAKTRAALAVALKWEPDALAAIAAGKPGALPREPSPPVLERRGDLFPPMSRQMEADAQPHFNVIAGLILTASERHPGVPLEGRWVFPDDPNDAAAWDALAARGWTAWQLAQSLAVIRASDPARQPAQGGEAASG